MSRWTLIQVGEEGRFSLGKLLGVQAPGDSDDFIPWGELG